MSKALSTDSVESLGQIDVGEVHIGILFLTFFFQLSCGEHHVDCTAILPEAALTLRQETILKMFEDDPSLRLFYAGENRNATEVVAGL